MSWIPASAGMTKGVGRNDMRACIPRALASLVRAPFASRKGRTVLPLSYGRKGRERSERGMRVDGRTSVLLVDFVEAIN